MAVGPPRFHQRNTTPATTARTSTRRWAGTGRPGPGPRPGPGASRQPRDPGPPGCPPVARPWPDGRAPPWPETTMPGARVQGSSASQTARSTHAGRARFTPIGAASWVAPPRSGWPSCVASWRPGPSGWCWPSGDPTRPRRRPTSSSSSGPQVEVVAFDALDTASHRGVLDPVFDAGDIDLVAAGLRRAGRPGRVRRRPRAGRHRGPDELRGRGVGRADRGRPVPAPGPRHAGRAVVGGR